MEKFMELVLPIGALSGAKDRQGGILMALEMTETYLIQNPKLFQCAPACF